ncbi:Sarcosine oxidase, gamma subunit family [Shimia sp. SK013]|uniref:sarcosine oxidase subunit gamma n=1 Tax=Shimia sp. SK013 TaxID=1389006 RepID=UPI0006B49082|nr:sarcosine oxidase subunit gamma family protein [Shimia sp. SK013]KPA22274.1 Sarcosine oxidase, gamma subunit family [Shimia sp. SK013]
MSEAVSALSGAIFEGFATVTDTGLRGMITVRGDLASKDMGAAIKAAIDADVPAQRRVTAGNGGKVAWMSPDELLVVVDYATVLDTVAKLNAALSGSHTLVSNVSDARAVFEIRGAGCRDVLAKLAPVDLSQGVFAETEIRRTRIAQVPAAFWQTGTESFEVICFRSVAQYVFDVLRLSATKGGEIHHLG